MDIKDPNTLTRCARLEAELAQVVQDHRFIPYIQRHEFEALVLAALDGLELELREDEQLAGLATLTAEVAGLAPEDINDSPLTAPSKRLLKHIPGYKKTRHGPEALRTVGLAPVRKLCPRFDAWVKQLEALGKPPHTP